jgi:hypothetical protein
MLHCAFGWHTITAAQAHPNILRRAWQSRLETSRSLTTVHPGTECSGLFRRVRRRLEGQRRQALSSSALSGDCRGLHVYKHHSVCYSLSSPHQSTRTLTFDMSRTTWADLASFGWPIYNVYTAANGQRGHTMHSVADIALNTGFADEWK